jgi:hypothetical protein
MPPFRDDVTVEPCGVLSCGIDASALQSTERLLLDIRRPPPGHEVVLPDRGFAHEEAAHGVIALRFGFTPTLLTAIRAPGVRGCFRCRLDGPEALLDDLSNEEISAIISLAGPIGRRWSDRLIYRPYSHELTPFISKVRNRTAGLCDQCKVFALLLGNRPGADDETLISAYRDYEARAIQLVCRDRGNELAISRIASVFAAEGYVSPEKFIAIYETRFLPLPNSSKSECSGAVSRGRATAGGSFDRRGPPRARRD